MTTIEGQEAVSLGVIRLEPTGIKLGATGISSSYDDGYPPELEGWMSREEWLECIGRINNALMDRFPCGMCRLQAYCCCPCTLGLSLLSMRRQAKEIERGVGEVISSVNQNLGARRRDVRFGFRRRCCRAWVQVDYGPAISSSSSSSAAAAAAASLLSSSTSKAPSSSSLPPPAGASSSSMVPAPSTDDATAASALGTGQSPADRNRDRDCDRERRNDFDPPKQMTTVAAMSGATQPFGEEPLSERGGSAALQMYI